MAKKDTQFSVVGKRQPRLDGPLKATGRSQFTDDVNLPGMLHGRIVRSSIPRGKIVNLDTSAAEKLPGVKAVLTHQDTNSMMYGSDQFLLSDDRVNCFGDEIAAVAAVDEDTAWEAAELIRVEYEPLPPVFSVEDAAAEGNALAPCGGDHRKTNRRGLVGRAVMRPAARTEAIGDAFQHDALGDAHAAQPGDILLRHDTGIHMRQQAGLGEDALAHGGEIFDGALIAEGRKGLARRGVAQLRFVAEREQRLPATGTLTGPRDGQDLVG